jgi:hypothetical protein
VGLCIAIATLTTATVADAQYFGRNKVQYREFKFEVLKTEHFDIYFYDSERDAAADVGRLAERWYARLSNLLDHNLSNRQPIVLYQSHADFEQTNVVGGEIGEGTGGVTEGLKRRVVLPLTGALKETDHVLGHELVHAFQYDMSHVEQDQSQRGSIERLPLWFVEGMAEYFSLGPVDPNTAMWMRDAVRHEMLPEIRKLGDPKYFPYRWGQALWSYIGGRFGDRMIAEVFVDALREGPDQAFESVLGEKSKDLSASWQTALKEQYNPIIDATKRPAAFGRPLSTEILQEKKNPPLYASPVLSPDGKQIVVFSERGMLSVDMYLADADTGAVIRKLVSTAIDPHYSSLQFINSAGSWRPDGQEFVVGAVRNGVPVLGFLNIKNGKTNKEKAFPRSRRDPESGVVARRRHDRVLRDVGRILGSVSLRSEGRHAATADERQVRRSGARLGARRQADRVRDRSLYDQAPRAGGWLVRTRAARSLEWKRRAGADLRRGKEHQPAVVG